MKRILVIDDDAMARSIFRSLLEEEGYGVSEAADGATGLRMFREGGWDLVVLDIFMPGLSGLDALQDMDPERSGVPVVVISGAGSATGADPLHLAMTLGASRSFSKDFEHGDFLAAVRELTAKAGVPA
jgi:DNA-binding response OmpR family regulator